MNYLGILAAFGTVIGWAACIVFFTSASRRIGVLYQNFYRVLTATIILMVLHALIFGSPLPSITARQVILMSISGFAALVVADTCLYESCIEIGPRMGSLLFSLYPLVTALLAWIILGERLRAFAWAGIVVTLAGVWCVISEANSGKDVKADAAKPVRLLRGVVLGFLSAAGQALGFIIAKPVMTGEGGLDPFSANLIRMIAATFGFAIIIVMQGKAKKALTVPKLKTAMLFIVAGVLLGNVFGSWLSLLSVKLIPAGIATTIMAMTPIAILPIVILAYKEKVTWRAALGAIVAVLGVAILLNA
jgi:drug/metabolite transporter (DMT)-like permease